MKVMAGTKRIARKSPASKRWAVSTFQTERAWVLERLGPRRNGRGNEAIGLKMVWCGTWEGARHDLQRFPAKENRSSTVFGNTT